MGIAIQYALSKSEEDDVRRFLLTDFSKIPNALLGGCMEREAYLDKVPCDIRKRPKDLGGTNKA